MEQKINYNNSLVYPDLVTKRYLMGTPTYTINYDIQEYQEDGGQAYYGHYYYEFKQGVWDYGAIVDAIVSTYYPSDKMQAVVNNYLLDPTDADALQEFQAMQEKRAWAKQTARELMAYAEEHGLVDQTDIS